MIRVTMVPDPIHPGMWRLHYSDGHVSDMVNLSRARDAAARFIEAEGSRQRGRRRVRQAPPVASNVHPLG
jgi:hypothetical protein